MLKLGSLFFTLDNISNTLSDEWWNITPFSSLGDIGYYNDNPNDIFETMDDVLLAISEFP